MDSTQGRALVASPYLTDPNFLRSVVYILRHDEEGAIGLVLNRPMHLTVGVLLAQLVDAEVVNAAPVYYGGPVDGPLMLLQARMRGERPSVFIASDQEQILQICDPTRSDATASEVQLGAYRVFDGYSGWSEQQLDEELRSGGWLVWDISPEQLFSEPDELWHNAIKQIGREILSESVDPSKMPSDPAYN